MSSPSVSSPSSPISTSSTLTEERSTRMMADVIKKYKTEELIDYLQRRGDLDLDNDDLSILRKQKISGFSFLELTEEKFRSIGLTLGPATALAKFIEDLKEQKVRSLSSYKTLDELKDVLRKYKVNGEDITNIKQFNPGMWYFSLAFHFPRRAISQIS